MVEYIKLQGDLSHMEDNLADLIGKPVIFNNLNRDEIESLVKLMEIRDYNEKTDIFEEGSIGNEFFILLSGSVWVRKKDAHGKEHQLSILCSGECFGEMALIDELPRSASVRALGKCRVAVLSRSSLLSLKQENVRVYCHILENISREFSNRLRDMDLKYVKLKNFIF
jgi:CRP-like cAMP-binding protein